MGLKDIIRKSVGLQSAGGAEDPSRVKIPVVVANMPVETKAHYAGVRPLAEVMRASVGLKPKGAKGSKQQDCESIFGGEDEVCDALETLSGERLTRRSNEEMAPGALVVKGRTLRQAVERTAASWRATESETAHIPDEDKTSLRDAVAMTVHKFNAQAKRLELLSRHDRDLPGWRSNGGGAEKIVGGREAYILPEQGGFRLVLIADGNELFTNVDNVTNLYATQIDAAEIGERFLAGDDAGGFVSIEEAVNQLEAASMARRAAPRRTAKEWRNLINRSDWRKDTQRGLIMRDAPNMVNYGGRVVNKVLSIRSAVNLSLGIMEEKPKVESKGLTVRNALAAQDPSVDVQRSTMPSGGFGFRCPVTGVNWVSQDAWNNHSEYSPKMRE